MSYSRRCTGVLGEPLNKLLIIAVLTSASASTQTTILPTARTTLSMAHWKAVTSLLARVHKRYLTPTVSTLGFGLLAIIVTITLLLLSSSVLADAVVAIGFPICFLLRLHRRRLRLVLPPRPDGKRTQLPVPGPRPADRRTDAVRDRRSGSPSRSDTAWARSSATSASTTRVKTGRRCAIAANAAPTPPDPTTKTRMPQV